VRFYLSPAHKMLCLGNEIVSRAHGLIILWLRLSNSSPRNSISCARLFSDASTIMCLELSTAQASGRGREGCCTYSLSLMYSLNQTESAILL
jgi:hypothetical protein